MEVFSFFRPSNCQKLAKFADWRYEWPMFDYEKYFHDFGADFAVPEKLATYYSDSALFSSALGLACAKGRNEILEAMNANADRLEVAHLIAMEPVKVEIILLDPVHRLAKVQWKLQFAGASEASYSAAYLLKEEPHKVVVLASLSCENAKIPG